MQQIIASLTSKKVTDTIDQIAPTFKNLPHLPKGFIDFLVTVAPWLAAIGGVLGVLGGLSSISTGLGMQSNYWMQLAGISNGYFLVIGIVQLLAAGIALLAFKPLQMKQKAGWILMFWNMVIAVAEAVVGVVFGFGVGSLIGMVIATSRVSHGQGAPQRHSFPASRLGPDTTRPIP